MPATAFRQSVRQLRRLEVDFGGFVPAVTADVSPTGFCADMMPVFMPGSRVSGKIELDGSWYPFKGEVTWARAGDPMASLLSRVGVRFTEVAPELVFAFVPAPKKRPARKKKTG